MNRIVVFLIAAGLAAAVGTGQTPDAIGPEAISDETPTTSGAPVTTAGVFPIAGIVPSTQDRPQMASAGDMIGFSHADASGNLTITLVHTGKSWMSVYHVDSTGVIRLVSSRPIEADFSLQLNATDPLPETIRAMTDRIR